MHGSAPGCVEAKEPLEAVEVVTHAEVNALSKVTCGKERNGVS